MPYRVTALIRRKPGMSFEEFDEYWGTNHAAIFANLKAVKENLVQYTQFHLLPAAQEGFKSMGVSIAPYDAAADFYVENLEDLGKLFADEEYQEKAIKDEVNFLDRESVVLLVGQNVVKHKKESAEPQS